MKKKIALLFISSLIITTSVKADFTFTEPSDYTGEAFFASPTTKTYEASEKKHSKHTIPPLKKLRIKLKNKRYDEQQKKLELAPTGEEAFVGEIETSKYAIQDESDNFEDEINSEMASSEELFDNNLDDKKKKKSFFKRKPKEEKDVEVAEEDTENIILDCEKVEYDTPNYLVYAKGNVSVEFVKQGSTVKADIITFDRLNNTIKAEGNVRILKGGQTITGDYIFVDLNEENALIENPLTRTSTVEIKSEKGYVYGDKIVQEKGSIVVDESFPVDFRSGRRGPRMARMLNPQYETLTDDISRGIITLKAQDIKITQKGDLEIISLKRPKVFKGDKVIFKTPSIKFYTNKNHDYGETNHWEIGAYRGLGLYAGPGYVFELPKGSVLKAMPMINYKSGFGVGAVGRFSSGTNNTMLAYGSAVEKFILYGKQDLDDNLYMQYGVNSYQNEWFLGRRRPKYGASLVYENGYSSDNFLIKNKTSSFSHRLEGGYYQDLDFDGHFEKLKGTEMGTSRFRYMAQAKQNFYNFVDPETQRAFSFDLISQLSTSIYGNGNTQVIGRVAPTIHTQYKRWMQDIGYYFSAYDDNTPLPVFDAYRYGKQSLFIREYFRINRYLTLSWFGYINMTDDSPNGKLFQENSFYISVGPDDVKLSLGYDFIRENLYCIVELMMDAKGSKVEYDKLEIKQDKKAKKEEQLVDKTIQTNPRNNVLKRAVVENVRTIEDVI